MVVDIDGLKVVMVMLMKVIRMEDVQAGDVTCLLPWQPSH